MEAQWQANQINISWYNGDSAITPTNSAAGQCTYDQAMVLPSNTLSKEGYTFDGWTVREQYCSLLTSLDVSISSPNGNSVIGYKANSGSTNSLYTVATNVFGLTENGTWAQTFSYGVVKGESSCNTLSGFYTLYSVLPGNTLSRDNTGQSCWCKATEVGGNMCSTGSSPWVLIQNYSKDKDCSDNCAKQCAVNGTSIKRTLFYGQFKYVDDCSVNNNSESCLKSFDSTTKAVCKWTNSICHNGQADSCSSIVDESVCAASSSGGSYCMWTNSICHPRDVTDCTPINNESVCTATRNKNNGNWFCRWVNSSCVEGYVDDCSTINNQNVCTATATSVGGMQNRYCLWSGSSCRSPRVSDCSTITNQDLCTQSFVTVNNACKWSGSVCHASYVDRCDLIQNEAVCNASRIDWEEACAWDGSSCYAFFED